MRILKGRVLVAGGFLSFDTSCGPRYLLGLSVFLTHGCCPLDCSHRPRPYRPKQTLRSPLKLPGAEYSAEPTSTLQHFKARKSESSIQYSTFITFYQLVHSVTNAFYDSPRAAVWRTRKYSEEYAADEPRSQPASRAARKSS